MLDIGNKKPLNTRSLFLIMASSHQFKISLVGEDQCGKTSFIKQHNNEGFKNTYVATLGVEVYNILFKTSKGDVSLEVWDIAGHEKLRSCPQGYHAKSDGALIMHDLHTSSNQIVENNLKYRLELITTCPSIEIVTIGNKCDLTYDNCDNVDYVISTKLELYCYEPFLHLIRNLVKDQTLTFV